MNKTITFGVAYTESYKLLDVGFVIENIGEQGVQCTLTGFTTTSNVRNCGTYGYLAIGY